MATVSNAKKDVGHPAPRAKTLRIKITPHGGYVLGDGKCPFDPDDFLIAFGNKIIEAQKAGLTEIGFTDEEVENICAANKVQFRQEVLDTPVQSITYRNQQNLIGEVLHD
jgi:hypothetical protein